MENSMRTQAPTDQQASDMERWASLIGGGALVLMGLQKRSLRGILTALAGGGLVYQGATNQSTLKQIEDAVGLENLPRFMRHLQSITVQDDRRSHWVAKIPLGNTVEWDAEIVTDEPNHLIAWQSAPGADVENSGFVRFQPATGNRGTEVKVVMEYTPPGGTLTATLAKLFGEEPEQQIGDELNRFKQLMEAGEIATVEGQPKGA